MTVQEAKNKLISWARAQVGISEGANNWNKFAENADLTRLYGWNPQNQPWCDVFVDVGFIECFGLNNAAKMTYQSIGSGSAACRYSAQFFEDNGAFTRTPEIGDQIFFYYNGAINHTGIVECVDGGAVHTIEGNSSDMVARRTYSLSASNIAGYGRPNWSVVAGEPITATEPDDNKPVVNEYPFGKVAIELPVLKNGMGGAAVAMLQGALVYNKCSVGACGVDGDFGVATYAAVRNFQTRYGLENDGIAGEQTWKALLERR